VFLVVNVFKLFSRGFTPCLRSHVRPSSPVLFIMCSNCVHVCLLIPTPLSSLSLSVLRREVAVILRVDNRTQITDLRTRSSRIIQLRTATILDTNTPGVSSSIHLLFTHRNLHHHIAHSTATIIRCRHTSSLL